MRKHTRALGIAAVTATLLALPGAATTTPNPPPTLTTARSRTGPRSPATSPGVTEAPLDQLSEFDVEFLEGRLAPGQSRDHIEHVSFDVGAYGADIAVETTRF